MSGRGDLVIAFAAAAAVHAGALVVGMSNDGGGGAGDGGTKRISVEAVSPVVASLVREWEQTPDTSTVPPIAAPNLPKDRTPETTADPKPMRVSKPVAPMPGATLSNSPAISRIAPDRPAFAAAELETAALADSGALVQRPAVPDFPASETEIARPSFDATPPAPDFAPQTAKRPSPRPAPVSAPAVTRRVATGVGEAGTRGSVQTSPVPNVSQKTRQAAASAWAAAIQRRIARHHAYPRGTRAEGRVRVAMVILPDGRLDRVAVARSSGTTALDKAAIAAVKRAAPFPPAPAALTDKWFDVGQWIAFERR